MKILENRVEKAFVEAQIDRSTGVIADVAVLGSVSQNGRVYSKAALRDVVRLAANTQVFLDHPRRSELADRQGTRSLGDLIGSLKNVRLAGDMVRGDLVVLDREPTRSLTFAIAESPSLAGLSLRASGDVDPGRPPDFTQTVRSVTEVQSVDLVATPATVTTLFESIERDREDGLRERAQAACRAVGMEEQVVAALGHVHYQIIGGPEDPAERLREARELFGSRRGYQQRQAVASRLGGLAVGPFPDDLDNPHSTNGFKSPDWRGLGDVRRKLFGGWS